MNRTTSVFVIAFGSALLAAPSWGGEVNGKGELNPLAAASICQFSGLNDDPDSEDPDNPPGRVQSYGQDVVFDRNDPRQFNPGDICNPNILPWKPIGHRD